MKRDQYIPHEVSMRSTSEVMNLIEHEGVAGYGIYWALMEYLRTQDDYVGDTKVMKSLARQLKVRLPKMLQVLNGYGLFLCNGNTFYSPKLTEVMKPFDRKRALCEAYRKRKDAELLSEDDCNPLKNSDGMGTINKEASFEQPEPQPEPQPTSTSKEEEGDDDVVDSPPTPVPITQAWERYIDELQKEQQWIEVMAMRSGLGLVFVNRFPDVLRLFKLHVQAVGNEKDIRSPGDAKRYFCFYNTPGSAPFRQLIEELQKPVDKGKYRYEDVDAATGQRSYCGIPILPEAPPRPNNQAVWNEGKWVY